MKAKPTSLKTQKSYSILQANQIKRYSQSENQHYCDDQHWFLKPIFGSFLSHCQLRFFIQKNNLAPKLRFGARLFPIKQTQTTSSFL
jgi:hypothetical protein